MERHTWNSSISLLPSSMFVWQSDSPVLRSNASSFHPVPMQYNHHQSDFPTTAQSSSNYNTDLLTGLNVDPKEEVSATRPKDC